MTRREIISEARRLFALAWPVALTSLQWILLNLTDTALVGHFSTDELGSLGAGRAITWVAVVMGIAGLTGVLVFAGRADGAGERHKAGDALRQGLVLAAVYGVVTSALIQLSADHVVALMEVAPPLRSSAALFTRVITLGLPFQLVFSTASYFMEGISRPRVAMIVNIASLPVNALLAYLLINGHLMWGPMGAAGAGLATVITTVIACTVMLILIQRMPDAEAYGLRVPGSFLATYLRAWREGGELRRFAVAPGIAAAFELAGFSILMAVAAHQNAAISGAFQAAISLHVFSLAASGGLASAAGVRAANAVGEGRPDAVRARTLIAAGMAALTLLSFGAVYLIFAETLLLPFSEDPEVVALGAAMLRIFAPFLVGDGVQFVLLYALRSLGDQKIAGVISTVAFFGVMGLGGWALAGPLGLGPLGLAWGVSAGIVVAAIGLGARFWWRTGQPVTVPAD